MGQTLQIGPLTLPWSLVILIIGGMACMQLFEHLARKQALPHAERHSWQAGLLALLAARLAFVAQYASAYASNPWSIIDIRDGGWEPWAGLITLGLYVLVLWIRQSPLAKAATIASTLFAGLWIGAQVTLSTLAPANAALPPFTGVALNAQNVALPELKGQPVVINLWASWCPPCRREMPVLLAAQQAHPNVRFLWINEGEKPEVVLRAARQFALPDADVIIDSEEQLGRMLQQRALPTTLFFDAQGKQVAVRSGELSKATLTQHLEQSAGAR